MSRDKAPFIPTGPDDVPIPAAPWRVFGSQAFFRLWIAQCSSSLGDWVGFFAILQIATGISHGSAAAISLVMVARVIPGFFLGSVGGVIVDRFDRRKVMVACDLGRAGLLAALPFVETLAGLVVVSFVIEIFTLLWGTAEAAVAPHLVPEEQLASANSLSLVASYGTFPLAAIVTAILGIVAKWLGTFGALSTLGVDRQVLALWFDGLTFLVSAAIVWRLPIRRAAGRHGGQADWKETFREIAEGYRLVRSDLLVRGVILGLGGGIIGGGAMIPLGPIFARDVLGSTAQFNVLMFALGIGAATGIGTLVAFQRRLPRETVFALAVVGTGTFLVLAATSSNVGLAALMVLAVGAGAGTAYVTGFTVLQENVVDELRGRIFATLYTVVRMCLLISLTVSPLFADLFQWLSGVIVGPDRTISFAHVHYSVPGVRIALWAGGLVTITAGVFARAQVRGAQRLAAEPAGAEDRDEQGPEEASA